MKLFVLVTLLMAVYVGVAVADPTVVDVTYSHRHVWDGTSPDQTYPEGSVIAALTANNPVVPVVSDPLLIQVSPTEYEYIFLWDMTESITIQFEDNEHEIVDVIVFPVPVVPFDPSNHELPVVHITTEPANLWDPETGIHVWGNHDNCFQHGTEWERSVEVEFYDADGTLFDTFNAGLRIHGHYSRHFMQKSLRLYFDHADPPGSVDHDFFGSDPIEFKRLLLRTCRGPDRVIKDNLAQDIYAELGHISSRYTFYAAYLNQEYWGLFSLRERIDDEFIEFTHDLDDAGYILIKDGISVNGDASQWFDFLDWVVAAENCASHAFFQHVDSQLDLSAYIDWLFFNIYLATADNGTSSNLINFRPSDLKWQHVMWDEDNIMHTLNLDANLFRFLSADNNADYNEYRPYWCWLPWWSEDAWRHCLLFNHLMQNAEFRTMFVDRAEDLMSGILSPAVLSDRLIAVADEPSSEIARQDERIGGNWAHTLQYLVGHLQEWLVDRHLVVVDQLADFLADFRADVELSRFGTATDDQQIQLTWRTELEDHNLGFIVYRRVEGQADFVEIASYLSDATLQGQGTVDSPTEYVFNDLSPVDGLINYYQISHVSSTLGEVPHDWVEMGWTAGWQGLKINEFLASNDNGIADEAGQNEDWLEIYNSASEPINLAGLYLTDDLSEPNKWTFPSVTIEAGGFCVIWCDDDENHGRLHTSFKLSAGGEQIGISNRSVAAYHLIDNYSFGQQTADVSEGRLYDGSQLWVLFDHPTPGESNSGINDVAETASAQAQLLLNYPNPFNPRTTIEYDLSHEADVTLRIYDLAGRLVTDLVRETQIAGRHEVIWNGLNDRGWQMPTGAYFYRLEFDGFCATKRMTLIR